MIIIWDNNNKQWLEPMAMYFGKNGAIERVTACVPNADPLTDGWYDLKGEDLNKIAIVGMIKHNVHLLPKHESIHSIFLVMYADYDDVRILGAFFTEKQAEDFEKSGKWRTSTGMHKWSVYINELLIQ